MQAIDTLTSNPAANINAIHNEMLTTKELAEMLKLGRTSICNLRNKHPDFPPPIKITSKNLWFKHEIDAWLEKQASKRDSKEMN